MGSNWSQVLPKINNGEIIINAKANETKLPLPHNYEAILKDADLPIDKSSNEKLFDQLYAGVFLNRKREKYWIDRKSHKNNFMLFPRNCSIAWIDDRNMWIWKQLKETSDVLIDVAELLNVCWLDVKGKFDTSKLSPGTLYEVVFVVMLRIISYGWEFPVNLRIIFPDGTKQEKKENLMEKQREKWIEIHAGEFMVEKEMVGFVEFSLSETEILFWKRGLVVKGVVIRPKSS